MQPLEAAVFATIDPNLNPNPVSIFPNRFQWCMCLPFGKKRLSNLTYKIMKAFLFLTLLAIFQLTVHAEGVASYTVIGPENRNILRGHTLELKYSSRSGTSYVELVMRSEDTPPAGNIHVSIYEQSGKKKLVSFDAKPAHAPKQDGVPDGIRVGFHLDDQLIDSTEIMYYVSAGDGRIHTFVIQRGDLRRIATSL